MSSTLASGQVIPWKNYFRSYHQASGVAQNFAHQMVPTKDGGALMSGTILTMYAPTGAIDWQAPLLQAGPIAECSDGYYLFIKGATQGAIQIFKFDSQGKYIFDKVLFQQSASTLVRDCIVDSQDNAYVADANTIIKMDRDGNVVWKMAFSTTNIQFDHAGNIVAIHDTSLSKLDPDGHVMWSTPTSVNGNSTQASQIVIGGDDSIYVGIKRVNPDKTVATTVQKFSSTGRLTWATDVSVYGSLTLNSNGSIFVVAISSFYGVAVLSSSGALTGQWSSNNSNNSFADGSGFVYELDQSGNIWKYSSTGSIVGSFDLHNAIGTTEHIEPIFAPSGIFCIIGNQQGANPDDLSAARVGYNGALMWSSVPSKNPYPIVANVKGIVKGDGTSILFGTTSAISNSTSICAFDSSGALLYTIEDVEVGSPISIFPETDGGYICVGTGGAARVDNSGHVVWTQSANILHASLDSAGNLYCVGGLYGTAGPLYKISSSGAVLWQAGSGYSLVAVDSASTIVCAGSGHFCRYDSSGTKLYDKTFSSDRLINGPINVLSDGLGNAYYTSIDYTLSTGTTFGVLSKLDSTGLEKYETLFWAGQNTFPRNTIFDPATRKIYMLGYTLLPQNTHRPVVGKFDPASGAEEWGQIFSANSNSEMFNGTFDSNHNLIAEGFFYNYPSSYDMAVYQISPGGAEIQRANFDSGFKRFENYHSGGLPLYGGVGVDNKNFVYLFGNTFGPDTTQEFFLSQYGPPPPDDASLIADAPLVMPAGLSTGVLVKATNTGTNTWTAATGYKLDCLQPATWGISSVALSGSDQVKNLQTKVFTMNVIPPATPGVYPLSWQMEHAGTKFDSPSNQLVIQVVAQTYYASFVGQTVPNSMIAGQSYAVSLQFKNNGGNTWSAANGIALQSYNPSNNMTWGTTRIPLADSVPGHGMATFATTIFAPVTPGNYSFTWRPIQESTGLNFGPPSTNVMVSVSKVANAARFMWRTGTITVKAGTTFWVQNIMLNVGTTSWTSSGGYSMMAVNPNDNTTWGTNRLYMPANSVIPFNMEATFTGFCTAPTTPGTYSMQWQCDKNGTPFGDLSPQLTIIVTSN